MPPRKRLSKIRLQNLMEGKKLKLENKEKLKVEADEKLKAEQDIKMKLEQKKIDDAVIRPNENI